MTGWDCWNIQCSVTNTHHSGQHGVQVTNRQHNYEGPSQFITVTPGQSYHVSGWFKLLNNPGAGAGEKLELEIDFTFPDDTHQYVTGARHDAAFVNDDWVHVAGAFTAPNRNLKSTRFYFQGPEPGTNFVVDDASVTPFHNSTHATGDSHSTIDQLRKSDINIHVTTAAGINPADVRIHVQQTKKSFPFGTAVNAWKYNANDANGKYRDFIHKHFNWAVHEASLKWPAVEPNRGELHYDVPLTMLNGLRSHGIKVRGHNLVWSVPQFVQDWVKGLSGNDLRNAVRDHINEDMHRTHGLVEHWDVNNENLHGRWYQDRLGDNNYNVELFRLAHAADPNVKLFLNDYNVVANWGSTNDYLAQARQVKSANVGLYGLGAQCHFGDEEEPDANGIKDRLDTLAQAGLPIWATELDVMAGDENRRADFYEKALRALYGHPSVEGILFWGFWDQAHWRGNKAALVTGNNLDLTAAGRRVLDLLENQWMTDDTRLVSQSGNRYTVRGFHGDYEVHVLVNGQERTDLKSTFTLGTDPKTVNVNVHP